MNRIRAAATQLVRSSIFALDRIQQRRHGVYVFETDPLCIMRISRVTNRERRVLSDGAAIGPGDQLIEIHFWNERMPIMADHGPDMSWGIQFTGRFRTSLKHLARYMAARPEYDDIVAVFGESSFAGNIGWEKYHSVFRCLGFDFAVRKQSAAGRIAGRFVHAYVWTIVWVLNPASLKGRLLRSAERGELWISRAGLNETYGENATRRSRRRIRDAGEAAARTTSPAPPSVKAPRTPSLGEPAHGRPG